jgi:hypothetical protein
MDAFHIADIAGTAVASVYGGSVAGQLASDGLSALGSVLQGYVDSKIPSDIVAATPGIEGLGSAALGIVDSSKIVKQSDVDAINAAAAIVLKAPAPVPGPATSGIDPDNQAHAGIFDFRFSIFDLPIGGSRPDCEVQYVGDWLYTNAAGTWPMLDRRSAVSPLGTWWRDEDGVEYQRL